MARKSRKNIEITNNEPEIKTAGYIRTAQYIRLSVEDSKNKGNSIENQQLILDDFIAQHPNMRCTDVYIDNGTTGTNFNRPEFQRLTEDIEADKIDCVIVKDLSRLGRNTIDTGFYLDKYFPEHKIRFISVTENFDSAEQKSNDSMLIALKNIINEAYALDIGKKIRTQARQAMRDGQYVAATPCYGYLKDPKDCHKLIVNPETAPIIKMIYDWFVGGMSTNEICLQLVARGIPTPSVYGHNKGYLSSKKVGLGKWNTRTIQRILKDEVYTGKLVQGKSNTIEHKQLPQDKSKWIVVENTHEAIISQELFDKAQARTAEIKAEHAKKPLNPYNENIFKGKIFCGHCGRPLHRNRHIRKTTADRYFFTCLTNTRYERGACESGSIYEDELLSVVLESLKAQAGILIGKKNMLADTISDADITMMQESEIKRLKAFISKNQNFLSSLYENLVNGIITPDEYQEMRKSYGDKISEAVRSIHEIENKKKVLENEHRRYLEMNNTIEKLLDSGKFTKEIVDKLVSRIAIYNGKRVEITFNFENEFESEAATNE